MNDTQYYRIRNAILKTGNIFSELNKIPGSLGTGVRLYPSEIHNLEIIGHFPGINITGLSAKLGVTKPSTTEIVNKLEKKALIEKYKAETNRKEVLLKLTSEGKKVFLAQQDYLKSLSAKIRKELQEIPEEQVDLFAEFLEKVPLILEKYYGEESL